MTPRFFRRAAMISWSVVLIGTAGVFLLPASQERLWSASTAFLAAASAFPVAFWSLVGLACARAARSGRGWTSGARVAAGATWLAATTTFVPILSTGDYFPTGAFWQFLLRMTLPLWLLVIAVAYGAVASAVRGGDWTRRLGTAGTLMMGVVAVVITAMVIVDSGNRVLFAGVGVLLLAAIVIAMAMSVIQWRLRPDDRHTVT